MESRIPSDRPNWRALQRDVRTIEELSDRVNEASRRRPRRGDRSSTAARSAATETTRQSLETLSPTPSASQAPGWRLHVLQAAAWRMENIRDVLNVLLLLVVGALATSLLRARERLLAEKEVIAPRSSGAPRSSTASPAAWHTTSSGP